MQRVKNLKRVVILIIILSFLTTLGVAFFRGGTGDENGVRNHGHEETGGHHHSHEKSAAHSHK